MVPLIAGFAKRVESHYPEIAGPIILFNTGAVIAKAFQWVRPMLDRVTMEKVELHAGVPTERFLELMPAAVLPRLRRREYRDELPGDGQSVIYIDVMSVERTVSAHGVHGAARRRARSAAVRATAMNGADW